ncbi:hypothetical protein PM082_014498 [Marasmius tenuissimus]|nr:hypothetical protein PM082_014498 [Marasmius tenuissimus]
MLSLKFSILCFFIGQAIVLAAPAVLQNHELLARNSLQVRNGGFNLPIRRTKVPRSKDVKRRRMQRRQDVSGATGLGNNNDLLYTVPITLGNKVTAVHLDTGSSDLWAITDQCTKNTCAQLSSFTSPLPSTGLNLTQTKVQMQYGDSLTGTTATGTIAVDTATLAGIAITNQAFGAVSDTTNSVVQFGAAGILGLGFPSGSEIQEALVSADTGPLVTTDAFVKDTWKFGPVLSRISMTHMLKDPMFTIELQRSTIDADEGEEAHGQLTVGKLPDDVKDKESEVLWVPVKLYTPEEGGLRAPDFAKGETYPFRWEIELEGVFFNGQPVANSKIPAGSNLPAAAASKTFALIDTGNSLLRGPKDVVDDILGRASRNYRPGTANSATFPCTQAQKLEFQIGGKRFPIDPRDFIGETSVGDTTTCVADNLVETDAPSFGATFRWSLGDPFFKSNLVAFHYGNLTNPSVDPPRIGLLSRVPTDADAKLTQAVQDAKTNGGKFDNTIQVAPTDSAATAARVTVSDDPNKAAKTSGVNNGDGATPTATGVTPVVTIGMDGPDGGSKQNGAVRVVRSGVEFASVVVAAVGVLAGVFGVGL